MALHPNFPDSPYVILAAAVLLLLVASGLLADETITGKVIQVTAGDTFTLLNVIQRDYTEQEDDTDWGFGVDVNLDPAPDKEPTVIHLAQVDAPEMNQPYGPESKKALAAKILGRVVKVTYTERDRQNNIAGEVYLGECWINQEALAQGWVWHDKRYADNDLLDTAEQQAQTARAGLWAGDKPEPPWEWRKTHQVANPQ